MILTHTKDFSAQVVFENVEEDLNIEPHAEVDEDGFEWPWCDRPEVLVDNVIGPEA